MKGLFKCFLLKCFRVVENKRKRGIIATALTLLLSTFLLFPVLAADYTMNIHGCYRHPISGVIEDSGGEANEALGQSMVNRIMAEKAYYEEVGDERYLSVEFGLANSISDVHFDIDTGNGFIETGCERFFDGDNVADYRIKTSGRDAVLRVRFFVEPMGRNVVFFIYGTDFVQGNSTSFPSLTEHTEGEASVAVQPKEADIPPAEAVAYEEIRDVDLNEASALSEEKNVYNEVTAAETEAYKEVLPYTAKEILEGADGIIVGPKEAVKGSGREADKKTEYASYEESGESRLILEDGTAATLFLFVLAANLSAGILLIAFYFSVKALFDSRNEKKRRLIEALKRDSILDLETEGDDLYMEADPELEDLELDVAFRDNASEHNSMLDRTDID